MDGSTTTRDEAPPFRSPARVLIPKLVHSRDQWKAKATRRKHELKAEQIRTRDLSTSRQRWKGRALAAEQQVQALQRQLQQAQGQLAESRAEAALLQDQVEKKRLP